MLIAFIVWSIVALVFVFIGLSCYNSDKPVGFFTFSNSLVIEDVKTYNNAVVILWFISAVVFEIIGLPFVFLQQNSPWFVFVIFAVIIWVIVLIIAYIKIEEKYRKS